MSENASAKAPSTRTRSVIGTAPVYRPDLDGLRGLAIAFVVFFHVWMGRVSGGVDVFLTLSGFFFLGSLVRGATRDGFSLNPLPQLWRLARRLIPVLAIVIAATMALTMSLRPQALWTDTFSQSVASLLYYQNWELALTSQDYAAADASISPLQHLWSMSVQGQFYLIALVLVFAVAAAARLRRHVPSKWLYAALFAVIVAVSLWWAARGHTIHQAWNYYDTAARLWELFIGGVCAIALGGLTFPWMVRMCASLAGVAAIISCGLLFDGAELFPAWWALYPVGGALLVIIFGAVPEGRAVRWYSEPVAWVLSCAPMRRLGDLAYGLYLWHWPLLITYLSLVDEPVASPLAGTVLIAVSLGLAWLTERLIERPLRMQSRIRRTPETLPSTEPAETAASGATPTTSEPASTRRVSLGVASAAGVVVLAAGFVAVTTTYWRVTADERNRIDVINAQVDPRFPGALSFLDGRTAEGTQLHPTPTQVGADLPISTIDGCIADFNTDDVVTCVYGDPTAEHTIALVGGSHSEHWLTAFDAIGKDRGFRIVTILKMGCPLTLDGTIADESSEFYAGCTIWTPKALETLVGLQPDYAAMTGTRPSGRALPDFTPFQYVDLWEFLAQHNIPTLAIRDTPWLDHGQGPIRAGECLAERDETPITCGMPRNASMAPQNPAVLAAAGMPDVHFLDLTDAVCDENFCPAVIGNVIVYHDSHHLSASFVRSLIPEFSRQLQIITQWW